MTNKEKFLKLVYGSDTVESIKRRLAKRKKIRKENKEKLRKIRDREKHSEKLCENLADKNT